MLKIFSFTLLIISFVLFSCAKSDDDSSSNISSNYPESTSGATASGTITIGSDTISGTYASVCGTSSDSSAPSDSTYLGFVVVVTSSTSYTRELNYYTDSACTAATLSLGWYWNNDNVSIGDASGSDYKMTYTQDNITFMAKTTAGETHIENSWSSISLDVEVGTAKVLNSGIQMYNLIRVSGGKLYIGNESSSAYPSAGGEMQYVKQ
jgi:hypothetical protein